MAGRWVGFLAWQQFGLNFLVFRFPFLFFSFFKFFFSLFLALFKQKLKIKKIEKMMMEMRYLASGAKYDAKL